jgi:hypothetical protein
MEPKVMVWYDSVFSTTVSAAPGSTPPLQAAALAQLPSVLYFHEMVATADPPPERVFVSLRGVLAPSLRGIDNYCCGETKIKFD